MSAEAPAALPFTMLGDPGAAACVGDSCEIPQAVAPSEHAVVIQRLDEDLV